MHKIFSRFFFLSILMITLLAGCSSYQATKDAWKGTKNFWNSHVSPAAEIDYGEKGTLTPSALELTNSMMGIDQHLNRLERTMMNADKPPTKTWVTSFMSSFPWLNGFAGVRYDGNILGQNPAAPLKRLDFIPLLYEDKKQSNRALRAHVQNTDLGPEVMLAVPLYDSSDFLGVLVSHFDMRTLAQFSGDPANIVILSPQALLWPGKYDFAATPLAGIDWQEVVTKSSSGTCKNATGTFYYLVRYFGNLSLVFAVPESGAFPEGDGDPAQGLRYFPKEAEKLPPPPLPERKSKKNLEGGEQLSPATAVTEGNAQPQPTSGGGSAHDIQPGSSESVLLKNQASQKAKVQERKLEGEDVPVERVQRPRVAPRPAPRKIEAPVEDRSHDAVPHSDGPTLPGGRPSPFGPRGESAAQEATAPETPKDERQSVPAESPSGAGSAPNLPGGRPSPFGPRD